MNSNTGRSSSAAAANASFRGTFGFIAVEIAVPLQASLLYLCNTKSEAGFRTLLAMEGCI